MSESLEERVKNIVSIIFNLPLNEVSLETSQKTVPNWDSLNLINLMLALESEFGIELGIDQAINLVSVKVILDVLEKKGVS